MSNWKRYFEATKDQPPNDLLLKALPYVQGKHALDLGAGALRDSNYLAELGFSVIAVDSEEAILDMKANWNIERIVMDYVQYLKECAPIEVFDLVTAQWALSFGHRNDIEAILENIKKSLKKGGIFTGNIFGTEDPWNEGQDTMSFLKEDEIKRVLTGMEYIYFAEMKEKRPKADGEIKDWHYFEFIVRKG